MSALTRAAKISAVGRHLARVLQLIALLRQTQHGYTRAELAERLGVSLQTLEYDLRIIEAAGGVVYKDASGEPGHDGRLVVYFGVRFEETRPS